MKEEEKRPQTDAELFERLVRVKELALDLFGDTAELLGDMTVEDGRGRIRPRRGCRVAYRRLDALFDVLTSDYLDALDGLKKYCRRKRGGKR